MYQALTGVARAVGGVLTDLGGICFLLLVLLFPSGRFVPRWIWAPVVVAVGLGVTVGGRLPDAVTLPVVLAGGLSFIGGQIYRYRRVSSSVQRQQMKWGVTGIVLAIVVNQLFWQPAGWIPALNRKDSLYTLLRYPDLVLLISILAVCFGVAIIRYRLYDIDLIIRRTLIYGTLTAILAGMYAVVVIVAQMVGQRLTGHATPPPWLIVMTTLLVAALFNPLRRRIQLVIDQRFYRSKYDATRTIEAFAATLRGELDLEGLSAHLVEVTQATMQPAQTTLWLRASTAAILAVRLDPAEPAHGAAASVKPLLVN